MANIIKVTDLTLQLVIADSEMMQIYISDL